MKIMAKIIENMSSQISWRWRHGVMWQQWQWPMKAKTGEKLKS
jgi:hypothetical protein